MTGKYYSKEEIAQHITQWQESGLNQTQYARQQDLNPKRLSEWWNRHLKKTQPETSAAVFIPATLAQTADSVTVNLRGDISISCKITQLPQIIAVLGIC